MITNTKHQLITNTHLHNCFWGDGRWRYLHSLVGRHVCPAAAAGPTHTHGPTLDWWTQTHTHNGLTHTLNRRASVHTHGPTQSHSLKLTAMEMHLHCFGQLYKLLPWVMLLTRHMVNMELTGQCNLSNRTSWHTDKEHWRKFVSVRSYCGRYTMPNLCV